MREDFYTLITGASEGFGKALAIECGRRKMNLILVSLPGSDLHGLSLFIKLQYGTDVISIEKDLCEELSCLELFNEINVLGLRVNMIFNNAGIGSTGWFDQGDIGMYERQIKLNVLATTRITHLFLDMLKQNSPSYLLNVGSLACYFHLPKKQVYGATKSFIYYFSKSLRKELKKDNVFVTVLCPGGMNTNAAVTRTIQSGNYFSRVSSMSPEEVVPLALDGLFNKKAVIIPGRLNRIFLVLDKLLPSFIKTILTNYTMKSLNGVKVSVPCFETVRRQDEMKPGIFKTSNYSPDKIVNHV